MKRILSYVILSLAATISLHAQDLQTKIQNLIDSEGIFNEALIGICVRTADGRTLADIDAEKMLMPASNMKLISTGAALHVLGSDYTFETIIGHDGEVRDGVLHGNLYIIGGGDPTTGSKDSIAVATEVTFAQWEAIVRAAGINEIEGKIVGDGRMFEGMAEEPTWQLDDTGTYFGSGVTGLMFYENTQSFSVSAGPEVGSPVRIEPYYPEAPWMEFRYSCTTGVKDSGDQLYLYASDLAPIAEIRGTFGVNRAAKRLDCANKFPEYTCAYYFHKWLNSNGITCTGEPTDLRLRRDWEPASLDEITILGSTFSPTLDRIVFETNHASNNLYAETLLRTLGRELHDSACYDSSYVALNDALKALDVDTSYGARIKDGSGLSRQNYISADFICRFLDAMTGSPEFATFLGSLPSPGGNGTLENNMSGQPAAVRNRIKVKSGSMNGVRCYSGYILPADYNTGTPVSEDLLKNITIFSILSNNCTAPTWKVRPLLDKIMLAICSSSVPCQE